MFTPDVPEHTIDLDRPEADRWAEVIAREADVAGRVVREASRHFRLVPRLARWVFARRYERHGGLYRDEMRAWAKGLRVSLGTATMLNCVYELSHLRWPKVFGCTAGVRWIDGPGMVHARTLDWPLDGMGAATRLFRFRRGPREFVAVGVPGHVGVLSGMLPGGYSVTINWAPPVAFPVFERGPAFLLRQVLETCDVYADAVRTLTDTPLSSSVFFTVCGVAKGEGCVIERTQREAAVLRLADGAVVQANHHVAGRFAANNADIQEGEGPDDLFSLAGSTRRAETMAVGLGGLLAGCSADEIAGVLNRPPVLNADTCQQMIFCPGRREVKVWRRIDG